MIELGKMAVAVLKNGTFGVNVQIAALSINPGDTRPPTVASANILEPSTAYMQLRDEMLAVGPYILCYCESQRRGVGQPFSNVLDYEAELMVGYFATAGNDFQLRAQAEYTLRAIGQAFDAGWFTAANRPIYGRMNGIGVMACTRRTIQAFEQDRKGRNLAGRLTYTLQMRDTSP